MLLDETFFPLLFLRKRRKNLRDKIRNERNNFLQLSKSLDSNREEPFSLKQRWREAGCFCDGGERFFRSRSEFLTRSSNMNRRERMVGIGGGREGCKIFAGPRVHRVFAWVGGTRGLKNFARWIRSEQEHRLEKFQIRQTTRSATVSHCRPITTRFL